MSPLSHCQRGVNDRSLFHCSNLLSLRLLLLYTPSPSVQSLANMRKAVLGDPGGSLRLLITWNNTAGVESSIMKHKCPSLTHVPAVDTRHIIQSLSILKGTLQPWATDEKVVKSCASLMSGSKSSDGYGTGAYAFPDPKHGVKVVLKHSGEPMLQWVTRLFCHDHGLQLSCFWFGAFDIVCSNTLRNRPLSGVFLLVQNLITTCS